MEIKVVESVLEKNRKLADNVRLILRRDRQSMFNFMSSPGAGKTMLLENLIPKLRERGLKVGVIEGDVRTSNDAERLQHLDIPIVQIHTEKFGGTCHLAANVILAALETMNAPDRDMIIVENVGNLICPGEYDTGADQSVVMLSVTEGEDKPLKYPRIFQKCEVSLISKVDIAEVLEADVDLIEKNMRAVNPDLKIFSLSGKSGAGLDAFADYLVTEHQARLALFDR